jgi:hypothetical protein
MRLRWLFLAAGLCACSSDGNGDAAAAGPSLEPSGQAGSGGAAGAAAPNTPGAAAAAATAANAGQTGEAGPSAAGSAGSVTPAGEDTPPLASTPPSGPLPDLILDAAYLIDTTVEDRIETDDQCLMNEGCVTGLGERRVVRFGSRMGNLGTAAFDLGAPGATNPYWTLDSCHEAYELSGFAHYELVDATGEVVLTGAKNGYCVRDSEPWELDVANINCYSYDCGGQGITPGCADNYGSELQCQWIDITGVPPGAYTLRVRINASRSIPELDYDNNGVDVSLEISDGAVAVMR